LFAGVSLEGTVVGTRNDANAGYYGRRVTPGRDSLRKGPPSTWGHAAGPGAHESDFRKTLREPDMGGQVTRGLPIHTHPHARVSQMKPLNRSKNYVDGRSHPTKIPSSVVPSAGRYYRFPLMPHAYALYISSRRRALWSGIRTQSRRLLSS
jgi:hypothetical protein